MGSSGVGIPSVPAGLPRDLTAFLQSLAENMRVLVGEARGASSSRAIREYERSGLGTGTASIGNGAVTTDILRSKSVTTEKLADGAVTEPKIGMSAVSTRTIMPGAVTAEKLAEGIFTAATAATAVDDGTAGIAIYAADSDTTSRNKSATPAGVEAMITSRIGATTTVIGKIEMFPFRATELPLGWYCCDGTRYVTATPQGAALNALSANYKADCGITLEGSGASETINVPNLFHADGRGCLIRAVDGLTRQVGSMQQDALQNITGTIGRVCSADADGAFYSAGTSTGYYAQAGTFTKAAMDASRVVRTDTETRPLNIGMTPAIFLGI